MRDDQVATMPSLRQRAPLLAGVGGHLLLLITLVLVVAALARWRLIGWPGLLWLTSFAAMTAIRLPHHARNRGNAVVMAHRGPAERIVLIAVFATMMVLPLVHLATGAFAAVDYQLPALMSAAGAVALAPMLWLFHRSHADLGRNWSAALELRRDHTLVTRGVYARWRHPMYIAIWLSALTQPLLVHNLVAGALVIPAMAALWLMRVPQEEAMMRQRFGADYDAYCARVGRWGPRS
jgi:protein-S-isoprenylcysteine O-methyltransferase Ste14